MALVVQKFGGTSVADSACIQNVAQKVVSHRKNGNQVVVVVSAPAGMTDSLLKRAREISADPSPRELDMILATGEQISISLLAMAIQALGFEACSYTAGQVGIFTDGVHNRARIERIDDQRIREDLSEGKIVIVAGFQGISENHEITTLGRGGSDITAVALGAALEADEVEIFTDVDGVYTADPRLVGKPRKIVAICFDEMLELAASGAKVLHNRCVELAAKYNLPIHLRSSFHEITGTIVQKEDQTMEKVAIRGIAHQENISKITVKGKFPHPGTLVSVFDAIAAKNVNVDIIVHSHLDADNDVLSFTVSRDDFPATMRILQRLKHDLHLSQVEGEENIAKVSVVGIGMKSHPGVAAKVFSLLEGNGIEIDMVSCSEIKIGCIISPQNLHKAVNVLHQHFFEAESQAV